jgi:hypothetical protein
MGVTLESWEKIRADAIRTGKKKKAMCRFVLSVKRGEECNNSPLNDRLIFDVKQTISIISLRQRL